ncbi:FliM/FliN family flagellar motor switch protein [Stenotrophomonas maltophilia]
MERTSVLEAVRAEPAQAEQGDGAERSIALIRHVQVALSAQIGTVDMSVDRLFGLKAGDEVVLNEQLEAPVTLLLNGKAVARAELVAIDDHFGVRILEIA